MLTLSEASSALKDYYLGVVTNQLNTKVNPLMARIAKSSENIYGRDVVKLVGYGINGGIAAAEETSELPKAAENRFARYSVSLKNLYGRIEISDKVIRATQHSSGAFVNMLNSEMEGLLESASLNLSRMLYGDGSGKLATVLSGSSATFSVNSVKKLIEGMSVKIGEAPEVLRVRSIDRAKKTVTLDDTPSSAIAESNLITVAMGTGKELTGLESVMSESGSIYGISRTNNPYMSAFVDSTTTTITEAAIQSGIDGVEEATGDSVNFIACSYGVKRALQNHLASYKRNIDTMNLEGGFRALSYNGIPVVADRFCADKTMYLLNTDYLTLYQLCDWEWLEGEGGSILRQIANTATYTATLVKYAELLCSKFRAQAALTNITEA